MAQEKKATRKALGRGLSSLISSKPVPVTPDDVHEAAIAPAEPAEAISASEPQQSTQAEAVLPIRYLNISAIKNNPNQPRQHFTEQEISELSDSIKALGVLQPVLVRPIRGQSETYYEIVAGERRWRAARRAELSKLPVIVRDIDDREALEISVVENVQRQQLNPVEEGVAYKRLIDEFGLNQQEVAERVGKDRSSVANAVRILSLPDSVLQMVRDSQLSLGHAKALLGVREDSARISLAKKAAKETLSVRALETMVSRVTVLDAGKASKKRPSFCSDSSIAEEDFPEVTDRLRKTLGTKVTIKHSGTGKGKIEIEYFSEQELDRVVDAIVK